MKKSMPRFDPDPYIIISMKGNQITAENLQHRVTRNSSFFQNIEPNKPTRISQAWVQADTTPAITPPTSIVTITTPTSTTTDPLVEAVVEVENETSDEEVKEEEEEVEEEEVEEDEEDELIDGTDSPAENSAIPTVFAAKVVHFQEPVEDVLPPRTSKAIALVILDTQGNKMPKK